MDLEAPQLCIVDSTEVLMKDAKFKYCSKNCKDERIEKQSEFDWPPRSAA